jgi:hypothetical protein
MLSSLNPPAGGSPHANQECAMQQIDEARLETDVNYRFEYLSEFMGFGAADIEAIHESATHLAPLVPSLVDAVYDKLIGYDATWRHFVPRQHGYTGDVVEDLGSLQMDSEVIAFRKQHLARYLERLVTRPYDTAMVQYLNGVGAMHTAGKGNAEIDVPLVQMNALMGFVADALTATILSLPLEPASRATTLRAFQKLLWLQNDLINRHYAQQATVAGT